ncbi:MAG: hypothetical protein NTX45_20340 [Proteobacteria bacterium]|nr:hypothetical protein [Pseudomonadota bacterium]
MIINNKEFDKCLLFDDCRSIIKVEENGRSYYLPNTNKYRVCCHHIDGCIIQKGKRCDYGIVTDFTHCDKNKSAKRNNNKKCRFYLIELKGADLDQAAKQIYATLIYLETIVESCIFEARIVLSRISYPKIQYASVVELDRRLAKSGGKLRKSSITLQDEDISD